MRHPDPKVLLGGRTLFEAVQRFYASGVFADEFDFVFFYSPETTSSAAGWYWGVNEPMIPGLGEDEVVVRPGIGTERLQGAIALQVTRPSTLFHEVLHRWGVYLFDPELPLTQMTGYSHWADLVEVEGRLGGTRPGSVRCVPPDPQDIPGDRMDVPPCERGSDGLYEIYRTYPTYETDWRYAPVELYLMGLMSPDEIPPFTVVRGVVSEESISFGGDWGILMKAEHVDAVTGADLVRVYGLRPLATPEERALRAAFILVTSGEPSTSDVERLDYVARTFGCNGEPVDEPDRCFFHATWGRATMDTRLAP